MTRERCIGGITQPVTSGRDEEALDFSARFWRVVAPSMSGEEVGFVNGSMVGAERAAGFRPASVAQPDVDAWLDGCDALAESIGGDDDAAAKIREVREERANRT